MDKLYDEEELVDRLFDKLGSNKNKKLVIPNLIIEKKNGKTIITNFKIFCETIKRDQENVKIFIEHQLAVNTSITSLGELLINKSYNKDHIDEKIKAYMIEYVLCGQEKCKSSNTEFIKENRITYLSCKTCNSKKSIILLKS